VNIKELLNKLTTEEKIGQLLQIAPFFFVKEAEIEVQGEVKDLYLSSKKIFLSGSVLGIRNAEEMIKIQKLYLERSKHQIPLLFMADIIHGYETIFPVPLALSCSWNPKLAYDMARISAVEAQTSGIHVTFSPMADLSRDPRWGRVVEGFGEDPELIKAFVEQMVYGYQQKNVKDEGNIASCVKHFAAYGAIEGGRDYNTVDLSRLSLYQTYLPGYKAAIDAGAKLIMTSFNVVDGIPATINKHLLRDILRDQWKFEGVTISDYDSLHQVVDHGCAAGDEEASLLGIQAGLDIEMASSCYVRYLAKQIEDHEVEIGLLDEAVGRVLTLKEELGLFDNPYKGASIEKELVLVRSKEHLEASKKIALESAVLLQNNGALPLNRKLKVALIGPYSKLKTTNGPWSWHGNNDLNHSLESTLISGGVDLIYVSSAENESELNANDSNELEKADLVIVAIGESIRESGEAHSKSMLDIPRNQASLVRLAKKMKKQVVVVLYNGRPLCLDTILEADSILETWFLGSMANEAIALLLTGKKSPSGKLTMSFPRNVGQIPVYYNHLTTGRPKVEGHYNEYVSYYLDVENSPLFPFGHGLSYATFTYEGLTVSKEKMNPSEQMTVSIRVKNNSEIEALEIIQLYRRDYVSKIAKPVKELKQFKKEHFKPFEEKTISFELSIKDLTYINDTGENVYEYGKFQIMVGPSSIDTQNIDIVLIKED
jgi:beta-glucosidase